MAYDRGPAHADDKLVRILTADGEGNAPRQDGGVPAEHLGSSSSSNANTRAPPIQEYSVERVEKVYR